MSDTYLTINGLKLDGAGFCYMLDHTDLERMAYRGTDFVAQGVAGRTYRSKVLDENRALVQLQVEGTKDANGTALANTGWAGINANLGTIRSQCVQANGGTALASITLTLNGGGTVGGSCYCPRLDPGLYQNDRTGGVVLAVLEVVIPSGQLT